MRRRLRAAASASAAHRSAVDLGEDEVGADQRDRDAAAGEFDAQRIEEAVKGVLGGGVAGAGRHAGEPREARHRDDPAAARLQVRQRPPGRPGRAEVVDAHELLENRGVGNLLEARPHVLAGVEDQEVEPAEGGDCPVDDCRGVAFDADIGGEHHRPSTAFAGEIRDRFECGHVAPDQRESGLLDGECQRERAPDAARGSGQQGHPMGERRHGESWKDTRRGSGSVATSRLTGWRPVCILSSGFTDE